jgi:hypothetical protein
MMDLSKIRLIINELKMLLFKAKASILLIVLHFQEEQ